MYTQMVDAARAELPAALRQARGKIQIHTNKNALRSKEEELT